MLTSLKSRFDILYSKYERWVPIAFFIMGFLFDMSVLHRIDELKVIFQQAVYLIVSALLIGVEIQAQTREITPPRILMKVWKYKEAFLHFLLGTLLNSYTIFYFKSASAVSSYVFIALLIALLIFNEFMHFGKSQVKVHVAFWSLCLVSYLACLAPMALGFIGKIPFLVSTATAIAEFAWVCKLLKKRIGPEQLKKLVIVPYFAIQVLFVLLYFAKAIPPVPLSVQYMGIYHEVAKEDGDYRLSYTRPWWKFWQHGDQTFVARKGDVIHCFAQIFSPTRFKDQLKVRWLYWGPRGGWLPSDAIPLPIVGGRDEGYRAVTQKANYQPGEWRVQIETQEGQEIGQIGFDIVGDESTDERKMRFVIR